MTGFSGERLARIPRLLASHIESGTPGEFAWGGMASTTFFIDAAEDMIVIFMTQVITDTARRIRLRRDLRTLVYGAMTESYA
ncbi:MAG TPA: hypothetical protein VMO78_07920 [Rhizomicrobium sp.]|nr:hypothetical protein [Rhizomicrobium sp.]